MIQARFHSYPDGALALQIRGHGGLAPYGQDILCAAVSALALTAAALAREAYRRGLLQGPPVTVLEPGFGRIRMLPRRGRRSCVRRKLQVIRLGLVLLQEQYPHHLQVTGRL